MLTHRSEEDILLMKRKNHATLRKKNISVIYYDKNQKQTLKKPEDNDVSL
jgi:hypothetical protein